MSTPTPVALLLIILFPLKLFSIGGSIPTSWTHVSVPIGDFGVSGSTILDGVWFQDTLGSNQGTVYFGEIEIITTSGSPPPPPPPPPSGLTITLDISADVTQVSRFIYGVNFADSSQLSSIPYPVNRWGGNSVTRYNWELDVSQKGSDWYFQNIANSDVDVSQLPSGTSSDQYISTTLINGAEVDFFFVKIFSHTFF